MNWPSWKGASNSIDEKVPILTLVQKGLHTLQSSLQNWYITPVNSDCVGWNNDSSLKKFTQRFFAFCNWWEIQSYLWKMILIDSCQLFDCFFEFFGWFSIYIDAINIFGSENCWEKCFQKTKIAMAHNWIRYGNFFFCFIILFW